MSKQSFHIILIRPSKYDDDGYVIRWVCAIATSNSLACMYALTAEAVSKVFDDGKVSPVIHVFDETVQKVPVRELGRRIRREGSRGLACLVGVQTNQYARALDLAVEFKKEGIASMIGGFHVSGVLAMLPDHPPEIQAALDHGVTLVAGEVEDQWADLLRAAYDQQLKPIYNFIEQPPDLCGAAGPMLPDNVINRFFGKQTTLDTGRGCPFQCSFCTIINIQGNRMRGRTVADIEKTMRKSFASGYRHVFLTDDNFSRHAEWEEIADRLIELKEKENIRYSLMIQVDTMAHRIPRFIEKMTRAGVRRVFIGLESVNPVNLKETGKAQNQILEYRKMLLAWRDAGAITYAGYILGFPNDTYDSIMRDVEFLKRELPLDIAEFFIMTPLPGSEDHRQYYLEKAPLASDTNLYDTAHVVFKHPRMSDEELLRAYQDAWKSFYSSEHCLKLFLRRKTSRRRLLVAAIVWFKSAIFLEGIHPLLAGFFRLKDRKMRRPGYPIEPFWRYYPRSLKELFVYVAGLLKLSWEVWRLKREADRRDHLSYCDEAIKA